MGIPKSFEATKTCKAIKCVDVKSHGACHVDGSAVSYTRVKTTEGRLLLRQFKNQAHKDLSAATPGIFLPLAQWNGASWGFQSLSLPQNRLYLPAVSNVDIASTNSATTQQLPPSSNPLSYEPVTSSSRPLPPPLPPPHTLYHDLNTARNQIWPEVAKVVEKMFDRYYKKAEDFIHFDGPPTIEKTFAHQRRQAASAKKYSKLSENLVIAETRLSHMEATPKISNSGLSRFKKFLGKVLFPSWINTRGLDARAIKVIVSELQDTYGWSSHQCDGQFDICAGKLALENEDLVVVTTDSDLLFMGVKELIRLQPKGTRFYSYPIKKIREHLGLKSKDEWIAAAIISLNDYDKSVGRTSFKTAVEEIKAIRKS
ncbi:hypothetical protein BGZ83_003516 [Gryganskiella cystojenkinii]|nr:hypothetical protein BGZ83_003516 [Gryganskiella cystojenkinii]